MYGFVGNLQPNAPCIHELRSPVSPSTPSSWQSIHKRRPAKLLGLPVSWFNGR